MIYVNARFLTQPITGVQRFAIEISLQLKELLKEEVVFVAPKNVLDNEYTKIINPKIIGYHSGHLWEQVDLLLFMRKQKSPLLCLCGTSPIFAKNKIVVIHDITFIRYPKTFALSFRLFYKFLIPITLKTSQLICSVSDFSASEISSYYHYPKEKICILPNAIGDFFKPLTNPLFENEKYILAVSSVKQNKNFPFILKIFERISEKIERVNLYIVGDLNTKCFNTIDINEVKDNPNIRILGRVNDEELIRLYSNAVVFLFPSLYEGFGIPVLEAQACGCPVIASNTSSLPEVLGKSAILLPPNEAALWQAAIVEMCKDEEKRKEMIRLGFKNNQRFSWKKSAEKIIALLQKEIST